MNQQRTSNHRLTALPWTVAIFLFTSSVAILFLLSTAQSALAAPDDFSSKINSKSSELTKTEARKARLQADLNRLAGRYLEAEHSYERTVDELATTKARLAKAQKKLKTSRKILYGRANTLYRNGEVQLLDVLLGASSFGEFVTRYDLVSRIGRADADMVKEIKSAKADLIVQKKRLTGQKTAKKSQMNQMISLTTEIKSSLARERAKSENIASQIAELKRQERIAIQRRQQAKLAQLRRERERLQAIERDRARRAAETRFASNGRHAGGSGRSAGVVYSRGGHVFPVAGGHAYSDTYGAPRSGGRRHQGADIFAAYGAPLVAVTGGSVRIRANRLGGLSVWLNGNDGTCYYYAHLSRYGRSGRVSAGTVIGYVGTSGNARGTPPHVHFEIHPGCGRAVNPTPYLRSWD